MNLIHVNRKVFNKLKDDEEICKEYLYGILMEIDEDDILMSSYENLTSGLFSIVYKNEALIEKYGMSKYYHSDYPASEHIDGCWYSSGKYGLLAFDWSMSNENDENWSYSFNVFEVL